jgi:hypothetical protein
MPVMSQTGHQGQHFVVVELLIQEVLLQLHYWRNKYDDGVGDFFEEFQFEIASHTQSNLR